MRVQNDLDRFHLVEEWSIACRSWAPKGAYLKQMMEDKLIEHTHYIDEHGEDMPEIRNWKWGQGASQKEKSLTEKTHMPEPNEK